MLRERIEAAVAGQPDPIARAEAALKVVLFTFAGHRRLARLFMVEALGSGPEFNVRMIQIRATFADLIRAHLDEAVAAGAIPPIDTATAVSGGVKSRPDPGQRLLRQAQHRLSAVVAELLGQER